MNRSCNCYSRGHDRALGMAHETRTFDTERVKHTQGVVDSLKPVLIDPINWYIGAAETDLVEADDTKFCTQPFEWSEPGRFSINSERRSVKEHDGGSGALLDDRRFHPSEEDLPTIRDPRQYWPQRDRFKLALGMSCACVWPAARRSRAARWDAPSNAQATADVCPRKRSIFPA